jgi:sporulation integral membrane protein YtvI
LIGDYRKTLIKALMAAALTLIVYLLISNRGVIISLLSPFIIGIIIAYLFNPLVVYLERRGLKRLTAVVLIYIAFIGVIVGAASYVLPSVYKEMLKLIDIMPFYTYRIQSYADDMYARFSKSLTPEILDVVRDNADRIQGLITERINWTISMIFSLLQSVINWVIAFVVAFYLLKDKDYFTGIVRYMIPIKRRAEVLKISAQINIVLARFVRGQLTVAFIVGILAITGFYIIGLNFALLMGIITGIADLIPYFGPIIGGIPVIIIGLLQSPKKALYALIVVFVVQQLESGIITPKVVGDSVGLHPVFIILSLFIAAHFFGVLGMLFAVPVAAVIKIIALHLFNRIVSP